MEFDPASGTASGAEQTTTSGGLPNSWWTRGCARCGDTIESTAEYCVACDEYVHPWLPDPLPQDIHQWQRAMRAPWPNSSAQGAEGFIARVAKRLGFPKRRR